MCCCRLRARGVEVVEFDFLTPEAVADYCYARGFLQVWHLFPDLLFLLVAVFDYEPRYEPLQTPAWLGLASVLGSCAVDQPTAQ